ncbi:DUF1517 domain-containing protein [Thermus tengchongensis]|uniref:DUF1517 domain-containing protein n=2 Tax=Thermus tengchongensis TaxID=1214928 RepID=A0ABY2KDM3_9DEIN|nr:DUF1517 domain-containing protein [Thermus tengchongensis]TFU17994.1 DUF1517 domain-containing protein [Thermus tengchongensis]
MLKAMRRLVWLLLLTLSLALAQKSGGGAGGRPFSPTPPPMSPGPAPVFPSPAPSYPPYPGPVVVNPGGGGSLGIVPVLVVLGLVLVTAYMVRGLRQAGEGPTASVARLRLALLARPQVQKALRQLAEEADTTSAKGLADLLDEAALLLLREEPAWRFGDYQVVRGSEDEVLARFDAWMLEERSKYQETFRHFEGKKQAVEAYQAQVEPGGRYLVVSLLLADRRLLPSPSPLTRSWARQALMDLAGSSSFTLLAAYLSWTPEREGEALTEEELLLLYPELEKL